jgi:serine/threonine protein kinase
MEHTMAKKNTLIGTPVFIAPEVIVNDEGYNAKVDIWSLGITAIELAETVPPYHNQNPMQVLMTIPTAPPPTLKDKAKWTPLCHSFVAACLTKSPDERPAADMLLNVRGVRVLSCLMPSIDAASVHTRVHAERRGDHGETGRRDHRVERGRQGGGRWRQFG